MTTDTLPPRAGKKRLRILLLFTLAVVILLTSLAWRSPQTAPPATGTPSPGGTASPAVTITATPRFPEYFTNRDQTNGVVLGSTVLVLIVIIGTLTVLRHSIRRPGKIPPGR